MSDPRVPDDSEIHTDEVLDPERILEPDGDSTPAEEREDQEAGELLEDEDIDVATVEP